MFGHIAAIVVASNLVLAAADNVPQFNVEPSCRATETADVGNGRTLEMCKNDEMDARGQLGKQWTQFAAADKAHCTQLTHIGGAPSYVELLVCLEMARDAKNLRDKDGNSTTGQAR